MPLLGAGDAESVVVDVPLASPARAIYLAYYLLRLLTREEAEYAGSLLVLDRWDTQGPPIGDIQVQVFRALESQYGAASLLDSGVAKRLHPSDLTAGAAVVALILLFQWDAVGS